jgi:hypothetical protein
MSVRFLSGVNVDSNTLVVDDVNNRVGVGTASPQTTLHVSKTDLSNELVAVRVQNDTNYSEFGTQSGYARILSGGYLLYAGSSNYTFFYNSGNVVMTTNYLGNVGIGTTSPNAQIHVESSSINSTHNVAQIGTLIVNGAGNVYNKGKENALDNTFFGEGVGENAISGINRNNTAFGYRAGEDLTTGILNTLIGSRTATNITTGARITAIGSGTLTNLTGGSYITAVGQNIFSLSNYSSGNIYNVGVGGNIGNANLSSKGNTFIGWNNALELENGGQNIGIGYMAFRGEENSSNNIFLGNFTNKPTGKYNENTIIGNQSLFSHTLGNENVSLGFRAGRYESNSSTANDGSSNSIFIGAKSRALSSSQTNQIVIGHDAIGLGSNTAVLGNDSIVTTALKGNVGIGTTSPYGKLDVIGDLNSHVAKFSNLTTTGYAPGSILLESGQSGSRGQGVYHYNSVSDESWFTGVPYAVTSRKWIVANKPDSVWNPDVAQLSYALMTIDSDTGNVGILTTSPSDELTVNSAGNSTGIAIQRSGVTKGLLEIGSSSDTFAISATSSTGILTFATNSSERMRITSAGNVGIGTTSPGDKLTVSGGITGNTLTLNSGAGISVTSYGFLSQTISGQMTFLGHNVRASTTTANTALVVNAGWISSLIKQYFSEGITFHTSTTEYAAGATYPLADTERMRITSGGNVGIGTTSPAYKLDVTGDIRSAGNIRSNNGTVDNILSWTSEPAGVVGTLSNHPEAFWTNGSERMRITAGGNVGIGTTSPNGHMLDIASTQGNVNNSAIRALFPAGGGLLNTEFGALAYRGGVWTAVYGKQGAASSAAYFDGNVGIGTPSPSAKLEVVGDNTDGQIIISRASNPDQKLFLRSGIGSGEGRVASNYSLELRAGLSGGNAHDLTLSTSSGEALRVDATNNNIGIGTTSPSYKLEVVGTAAFTGSRSVFYDVNGGNFQIKASTGGWATGYFFQGSSGTYRGGWGGWGNDDTLGYLWAGDAFNTPTLIVQGGQGNVGIGNTAPSQKLHVTGNLRVTGAYYDSNNEAGTSGQVLTSTGSGTDWKSLSEITGVDGTGTANYVAKWSDTDTITNSQIRDDGTTVGIGTAPAAAKLTVNGPVNVGGRYLYNNFQPYLDTTGVNVAGLSASTNGDSAFFTFEAGAGEGHYQRIVYSCYNAGGTWIVVKAIDEGNNAFDVVASASSGSTITFTWKTRSGTVYYTPRLIITGVGSIDTTYL